MYSSFGTVLSSAKVVVIWQALGTVVTWATIVRGNRSEARQVGHKGLGDSWNSRLCLARRRLLDGGVVRPKQALQLLLGTAVQAAQTLPSGNTVKDHEENCIHKEFVGVGSLWIVKRKSGIVFRLDAVFSALSGIQLPVENTTYILILSLISYVISETIDEISYKPVQSHCKKHLGT